VVIFLLNHFLFLNQLQLILQYYHTKKENFGFFLIINKLTLTIRFLKFLFNSPFILDSNKLIRRVLESILTCSFRRKAKLDRRPVNGGKSITDDRRRDERGSGCLEKIFLINF
jgi:hypothetical protein